MNNLSAEQFSVMMRYLRRLSMNMDMSGVEHIITTLTPDEKAEWNRILSMALNMINPRSEEDDYDQWLKSHEKY